MAKQLLLIRCQRKTGDNAHPLTQRYLVFLDSLYVNNEINFKIILTCPHSSNCKFRIEVNMHMTFFETRKHTHKHIKESTRGY